MKRITGVSLLFLAAVLSLNAQDGVLSSSLIDSGTYPYRYSNAIRWDGGVVAKDGGAATIRLSTNHDTVFMQDVVGLELSKLEFHKAMFTMIGNDIKLVGDNPYLTGEHKPDAMRPLTIALALKGEGNSTLTMDGTLMVNFAVPVADFAAFRFIDGLIAVTNSTGTIVANAPIEFSKRIDVLPNAAEGGHAELTLGNGAVTVLGDAAAIRIDRGGNDTLTLNLDSLVLRPDATLAFTLVNGISELGEKIKIKCANPPACAVDGKIDFRIIARDASVDHNPLSFLTYDIEKGFVPVSGDGIARISESGNVTASTNVPALVIDNHSSVTNGNGVVITVGDGINPAAVILNSKANASGYPQLRGGAIDFGTSHGIIYKSAKSGTGTDITTELRGQNGISFVSKQDAQLSPYVRFYKTDAKWTGATRITGLRYWLDGGSLMTRPFPDGGDVYVTGGRSERSGQIYFYCSYNNTNHDAKFFPSLNQHFHVSGYGCQAGDQDGVLFFVACHVLFDGRITLEGDSLFNIFERDHPSNRLYPSKLEFNAPIEGVGDLDIRVSNLDVASGIGNYRGSTVIFNAANTLDGDMVFGRGFEFVMNTNGTFGSGAVSFDGNTVRFKQGGAYTVDNAVSGTGNVKLEGFAGLSLLGESEFASLEMPYFGARLNIGANVNLGSVTACPGTEIAVVAEDAQLCVTGGVINGALTGENGMGVSLVKRGEGELKLGGELSGLSSLKIEEGTVKISRSVFDDPDAIEYWLDATDSSTLTLDESGAVVNWASKAGKDVNFSVPANRSAPAYRTAAVNGLNALLFTNGVRRVDERNLVAENPTRLVADRETVQRTLFIVNVPLPFDSQASKFGGLFGRLGYDHGIRMDYGDCWCIPMSKDDSVYYPMLGYAYIDGEKKVAATQNKAYWTMGATQVAAFFHPYHGKAPDTFVSSIGGYRTDVIATGGTNGAKLFPVDYNGYIAEVIAFNRMLSEDEILEVSDYLGRKWKGNAYVAKRSAEVECKDLSVEHFGRGRLDLGGRNFVVGSLSGFGEIVNSADGNATLTVTGRCDFTGKIAANVKLAAAGGSLAIDPAQTADIVVGNDEITLSPYDYQVPDEGLLYWLDASRTSTLTLDGSGCVTNWQSRSTGSAVSKFYWAADKVTSDKTQSGWIFDPPEYSTAGLNGKPAIKSKAVNHAAENGKFGKGSALLADAKTNTRTLFMVGSILSHRWYSSGIFGLYGIDTGFRFNNPQGNNKNNDISVAYNGCSYMRLGDVFRLNGVNGYSGSPGLSRQFVMGETFVLTAMINGSYDRTGYNSFPGYFINRSPEMLVSEVIAYDRVLSDEEIHEIERYLSAKWIENEGEIPSYNDTVLADGSTITIVAENGEVGKLNINGDLNLDAVNFALVDTKDLVSADKRTIVEVSGDLTGTIGEIARDNAGSWKLAVDDGKIDIFKPGFFLLMR